MSYNVASIANTKVHKVAMVPAFILGGPTPDLQMMGVSEYLESDIWDATWRTGINQVSKWEKEDRGLWQKE